MSIIFVANAPPVAFSAPPLTNIIDVPTAEVVDHYGLGLSFRFYSEGGLLTQGNFGVLKRLNIGFGLDTQRFIGSKGGDVQTPTINTKIRFFDGVGLIPAFAIGYDGQGYHFNKGIDEYAQREKGLYLVGTHEIFLPDLEMHAGINIFDFGEDEVFGFIGMTYTYKNTVAALVEYDNIHTFDQNRVNAGMRYYVTPSFSVDFAVRDMDPINKRFERLVRLNYTGLF